MSTPSDVETGDWWLVTDLDGLRMALQVGSTRKPCLSIGDGLHIRAACSRGCSGLLQEVAQQFGLNLGKGVVMERMVGSKAGSSHFEVQLGRAE